MALGINSFALINFFPFVEGNILQRPGFGSLLPLHAKYFCSWDMLLLQTSQDSLRCHGMPYAFQYVIFDVQGTFVQLCCPARHHLETGFMWHVSPGFNR